MADLLAGPMGIGVPKFQKARLASSDLTDVMPAEYRADAVVVLHDAEETEIPSFAVVFEAQRRRDRKKRLSWPVYVATPTPATTARRRCSSCAKPGR